MVTIRGEIFIAQPVEVVFDCVADERNEPRYNPRMVRADKVTPGDVGVGTRFEATMTSGGRRADLQIDVTEFDRPRRCGSRTTTAIADIEGTLTFEPTAGGTQMRWRWELRPKGAARLLTPLVAAIGRRQERAIWTGLKRYLET